MDAAAIRAWLVGRLAEHLGVSPGDVDVDAPLASLGVDSVAAVGLAGELEERAGRELSPTLVYEHPTIAELAAHLGSPGAGAATPAGESPRPLPAAGSSEPIAIVGMACRFPGGAADPAALWRLLTSASDAGRDVPDERWPADAYYDPDPERPQRAYTRRAALVDEMDRFDAHFFGISPREARRIDPQQRLVLEVAWEALEDSGRRPDRLQQERVGVFAGAMSGGEYGELQLRREGPACVDDPYFAMGTASSVIAGRLAYALDLRGPSLTVDTACSSSLVSVHLACRSLRAGDCELALAGGVSAIVLPETMVTASKMRMLARDGRCKTFDAAADGFLLGEGAGMVVLARLSDAVARGDRIHGVITGSAVNQDGRSNGLTAPSAVAQREVIRAALREAGIEPAQVDLVEAHGSGTALGDAIEMEALNAVYGDRPADRPLVVGAVKTNLGHLAAAAGMAGLLKVVLALRNGAIPPNLHLRQLNPTIAALPMPLLLPAGVVPWPAGNRRRAGVSSFGWSGTNAHLVVEEAPEACPATPVDDPPWQLLPVSARTEAAADEAARRLAEHLERDGEAPLADVAFTLQVSRSGFAHRRAVVARDRLDAVAALTGVSRGRLLAGTAPGSGPPPVAFVFPEVGGQHALAELWRSWGVEPALAVRPDADGQLEGALRACSLADGAVLLVIGATAVPLVVAEVSRERSWTSLATPGEDGAGRPALLRTAAELWLAGVELSWQRLHAGRRPRITDLPTYPFQRQRYWPVGPAAGAGRPPSEPAPGQEPQKRSDRSTWFSHPVWRQSRITEPSRPAGAEGSWLVFVDELGLADRAARAARQRGHTVVLVSAGDRLERASGEAWAVRPGCPEDYDALLAGLAEDGLPPVRVLHAWSAGAPPPRSPESVERAQELGFHSLAFLVQALGRARPSRPVELVALSCGLHAVLGDEALAPERATLLGFCQTVSREYPGLGFRSVDVVPPGSDPDAAWLAGALADEMEAVSSEPVVAYRGRRRWARAWEPVSLAAAGPDAAPLRRRGTYLVTGGLGGLGLGLAERLAETVQARLVLVGRSTPPPAAEWDRWLAEHDDEDAVSRAILGLRRIEALGGETLVVGADVTDAAALAGAVDAARRRFGRIHGVVHAAGVPGRGLLQAKTRDEAAAVLAPKVAGTLALDAALEGEPLDFLALYSSATAVVGGVGEVDYCAANAFLDAYAEARRSEGRPVVSIDWAPWQWDTWQSAAFAGQPDVQQAIARLRERHGIAMEEGFDALLRALGSGLAQVLVLPHGLEATLALWTTSAVLRMVTGGRPAPGPVYPRPHLSTPYVPPRSPAERRLAEIWMRQLGLEKVGVHDQFFELGGNSLIGLGLVAELERAFEVPIAPASLYAAPTIASQAELLAPSQEAPQLVAADSARGALRRQLRRRRAGQAEGGVA